MTLAPDIAPSAAVSDALSELARRICFGHASGRACIVEQPFGGLDVYAALANASGDAVLWSSPSGHVGVGFGRAAHVTARGRGRFYEIASGARQVFERFDASECTAPVRMYAGFAFGDDVQGARWSGFCAADAVLPEVAAEAGPADLASGRALLRVAIDPACGLEGLLSRVRQAVAALGAPAPHLSRPAIAVDRQADGDYRALVRGVLERIERGDARKIVAARRVDVRLSARASDAATLERLREEYPGCHRFAFRREGATFLGASPERLVSISGRQVHTVALAGSAAATPEGEAALQASAKDAAEHQMVVEHVRDALSPFCESLDIAATPRIRRLKHILHLETPISGQLDRPMNVLRLASLLHPTPAVGGVPTEAARDWIADTENADRGWYAGLVGWFDSAGDGELAVAIRSGLLRDDGASLWAGAGIVAGSDDQLEEAETRQKLRPLLNALGIEE